MRRVLAVQAVRRPLTVVMLLAATLLFVPAPGAGAAPGREQSQLFVILGRLEKPAAALIALGAVTGVGSLTAQSATFDQPTSSYRETDLVAVGRDTLTIAVRGTFSTWPLALEPPSCTRQGTLAGTWAVTAGTGAFTGASGGGTFTGSFYTYGPRTTGGCDVGALEGFVFGPMSGTVRLP